MVFAAHLALLALSAIGVRAGNEVEGAACNPSRNRLDEGTLNFLSDCNAQTWCGPDNICLKRGCRRDIYPYGYYPIPYDQLPPLCSETEFCPDEGSACLPKSPVGGPCQKDRDDQCQPPPNQKDLASYLNVNGSICLNFQCYYANVEIGQPCVFDNTWYSGQADDGTTFSYMVSRDNCRKNTYCDGTTGQCNQKYDKGHGCTANKECKSYNCVIKTAGQSGVCGREADEPLKPKTWVYVVIGLAIAICLIGVMTGLWLLHRRHREENQVKLQDYYNEQIAYRQSIMSMSHAKNSLLSLPANTTPEAARAQLNSEADSMGLSTSNGLLPPNIRREGSHAGSDDSEVLLMDQQRLGSNMRYRG
ncbi:hypothetical protein CspeluHIS016_0304250 [Cutaneotrichosporon spelunceum]|uniref:Uncharacterized protein n=1 Tax=Cutaneotrichosporon spelunceum TaxID=1672016 RepID=A0AAD3YB12_9TREE|nr:hypothetical protein CspeluHIS016_0304250 [Cutaneotrichosporon spelunceum]